MPTSGLRKLSFDPQISGDIGRCPKQSSSTLATCMKKGPLHKYMLRCNPYIRSKYSTESTEAYSTLEKDAWCKREATSVLHR